MTAIRFALRNLVFTPGSSLVIVLTFALGIASCAVVFGLINATLLRDLPFEDPDRLVWIENSGAAGTSATTSRVETLLAWREQSSSLEDIAAYFAYFDYEQYTLAEGGEPLRLRGVRVTGNFLDVLGMQPAIGRGFSTDEAEWNDGRATAVLLSHSFWQQRFNGDEAIVGGTVTLNDGPATVAGVLPKEFDFASVFAPSSRIDLLVPFPLVEQTANWGNTLYAVGRLGADASTAQASSELQAINARLAADSPAQRPPGARVRSLDDHVRGGTQVALLVLAAAVACLMLIACVNVSGLLLARATVRGHDDSVRMALGATRWHLLRQMMLESAFLAVVACLLGLALAWALLRAVAAMDLLGIPLSRFSAVDSATVLFAAALALAVAALATVLPAARLRRHGAGRGGSRAIGAGSGRVTTAVPGVLVVGQIALTCVLLVGAGLLVRSFFDVLRVDLGFVPEDTIAWRMDTSRAFASDADRRGYYQRLLESVRAVPGIESAGFSDGLPLGRSRVWQVVAQDVQYAEGTTPSAGVRIVDDGYLQTLQMPLLAGRHFDARDHADSTPAIILGRTAAESLWPGQNPIGRTAIVGRGDGREHVVVGIVADVPRELEQAARSDVYLNYRQNDWWSAVELVVRSDRASEAIIAEVRAAIAAFDPAMASNEYAPLSALIDNAVAPRRLTALMLCGFSLFALLLAAIGLYGTIAYSVARRTREMGVRMALGARSRSVLVLVLGEGARLTALGIVVGLAVALVAGRLMESLLFGVAASDPLTFAVNASIVTVIALLATLAPALRAARTQPMEALRHG